MKALGTRLQNADARGAGPRLGGLMLGGVLALALFFGGLGSWAALAPLASAAVAPGLVTVESNRKTVQHLEGGIISELLVRNGDRVARGQVLLRLEDVESRSEFDLLQGRRLALAAEQIPRERSYARRVSSSAQRVPSQISHLPQAATCLTRSACLARNRSARAASLNWTGRSSA